MFEELSDTTKFFLRMSAEIDDLEKQRDALLGALEIILPHADHLAECCIYDNTDLCDCAVSGARNKARAAIALAAPPDEVRSE